MGSALVGHSRGALTRVVSHTHQGSRKAEGRQVPPTGPTSIEHSFEVPVKFTPTFLWCPTRPLITTLWSVRVVDGRVRGLSVGAQRKSYSVSPSGRAAGCWRPPRLEGRAFLGTHLLEGSEEVLASPAFVRHHGARARRSGGSAAPCFAVNRAWFLFSNGQPVALTHAASQLRAYIDGSVVVEKTKVVRWLDLHCALTGPCPQAIKQGTLTKQG